MLPPFFVFAPSHYLAQAVRFARCFLIIVAGERSRRQLKPTVYCPPWRPIYIIENKIWFSQLV